MKDFRKFIFRCGALAITGYALYGPPNDVIYPVAFISFWVAFWYGLRLGAKTFRNAIAAAKLTRLGSAEWASFTYLRKNQIIPDGDKPKTLFLGVFPHESRKYVLDYDGARHLLTVAPTRSGKGVSAIIPNLLSYQGSVFVIDPKGENAMVTSAQRRALGQEVYLLDPWTGRTGLPAARFNPLDWIKADDADAAENAFILADSMVTASGASSGESKFWDDEAKALLSGLILYVATAAREEGNRHLGRVRDILLQDLDGFNATLSAMYEESHPVIKGTAARTAAKDPKLRSNVVTTTQAHTHFLDSPRIRESLSASDVRFEDLKAKAISIFVILPADRLSTFDRWLRLLIQQAIAINARNIEHKPEKPILFILDEMANLGRLAMVEQAYSLMAGFGMTIWGIVQDLSQLHQLYGDGWQTFISNSGVIQYFGSRDKMTAEYFSSLCGVQTIYTFNVSTAIGNAISSGYSSSSAPNAPSTSTSGNTFTDTLSRSFNETQRPLAYPDELMVLEKERQIIFVENLYPIAGEKLPWFEDAGLKSLGVDLHAAPQVAEIIQEPDIGSLADDILKTLPENLTAEQRKQLAASIAGTPPPT